MSEKRSKHSLKLEKLKKLIISNQFDLVGLTEVNRDWRRVKHDHTIWGATTGWNEHRRIQVSQNTTKPSTKSDFLIGGTALMTFGDLVFRISKQESDPRNLGRWSNISFTGKKKTITTIFTCYCPVRSSSLGSAYAQQLVYMSENADKLPPTNCPRQLFGMDLKSTIEDKMELGHNIIVMGDFNSDYAKLKTWMSEAGLIDLMAAKHGVCPPTHIKSKHDPLDCIFGSPSISIARGGFLSFHKLLSDHRGIWIDIPKFMLYGYNPPQPVFPSARRLKTNDPRVKKKYLSILFQEMTRRDLFKCMNHIHEYASSHLSDQIIKEYESIYASSAEAMAIAEKQCRKLHTGAHYWSPAYKKACLTLEYWYKRRSYFLNQHRNVRQLIVLQNKLDLTFEPHLSLTEIEQRLVAAHKQRHICIKNDESLSIEYRSQLALAKEEAGEIKAATFLKNQNHIEAQRRLFRNIRHMEGKIKGGSTSKVTIQSPNGLEEYTSQHDIDRLCAQVNERKYHQTEDGGSQLLRPEFIADLGHHGEGSQIPRVLDGSYVPPSSASPDTIAYLNACTSSPSSKSLERSQNDLVTRFRDFKNSWMIRKESTCTYNLHIGHYKTAMHHKDICWFLFQRADFPEITGYSPKSHRQCADLMIMKKSQCFELEKQRTIGILDTEFNQTNKKIGKTAMDNALSLNKVAPEQFAVKNTSAIQQIICKRCTIDHHHSKRKCFSLTSSDLAGCYDRIIHTAAALALLRVGIPHSKIRSMFSSIQRMVHKIRTMYGDSFLTYGGDDIGDWSNYPQGVLQGNASGPTIWVLVSSIIFDILHKRGFAVHICSCISKEVFKLVGFSYVDDCDLIQSGLAPKDVLNSMQRLINNWGSLMQVTGAALSVDKSWWYLVDYVWHKGKWTASNPGEDFDLIATSATGEQVSLKRLYAHEASEMLGVLIAPDGNTNSLREYLRSAALHWSAKVSSGNPSQLEAWQALHSNISAKLKYPLPASSLSQKQCKSVFFPAIKSALPKAGIASNLVSVVRDAPLSIGGAGVLSLFHYQGTIRTTMLVEQVFKKTTTGQLLLTCIEDLVLESGLYGSLWKMPFPQVSKYVMQHSLIYDIWKYNVKYNILISTAHGELSPRRQGDVPLMELAFLYFSDTASLKSIQRVRMALGVVHLSDICSVNGSTLDIQYLQTDLPLPSKNSYQWPSKHHINRHDMAKWRKFVKQLFPIDNKSLANPLGPWVPMDNVTWLDTWDFFITPDKEFLWHKVSKSMWHRHILKPHSGRSYHKEFLIIYEDPNIALLRASVSSTTHALIVTSTSSRVSHNLQHENDLLFFGNIQVKVPQLEWFMDNISYSSSTDHLLYHILQGSALCVSDGSYFPHNKLGSCAWSISTPDGSEYIKGGGLIPGPTNSQSPFRSELGGLIGLAAFLSQIVLPPSFSTSLTVACDGLGALLQVDSIIKRATSKKKDFDLIAILKHIWSSSSIAPLPQHVLGHQDNSSNPLTVLEKLNCQMDLQAKDIARDAILHQHGPPSDTSTSLGFGPITCDSTIITDNLQSSLYHQVTSKEMLHWLASNEEAQSELHQVPLALNSLAIARKESSLALKLFITKWLSGDTATGKIMTRRKQRLLSNCPLCDAPNEHLLHVITCPATKASTLRSKLLSDLAEWLKASHTHPRITHFINLGLSTWFTDQNFHWTPDSNLFSDCPIINKTLRSQLKIGWFYFLCGFISSDLVELQSSYFISINSKKSSIRWTTNLIKKLWYFLHELWTHRNECLHENESIHKLTRSILLKQSITEEYNSGLGNLPSNFSSYFHLPLPQLLSKNTEFLKRWFLIIRSGRECHNTLQSSDVFSTNGPLRRWIKLKPLP